MRRVSRSLFFFFNDTATTEIYTLSLLDALPILSVLCSLGLAGSACAAPSLWYVNDGIFDSTIDPNPVIDAINFVNKPKRRSEEHTSELQSQSNLVCRLLLEKKKYT